MERPKRPYSVQKRPTTKKSRHIYYVKFRNPETGEYLSAVSSGLTNKSAAENWADEQIKRGKIILPGKRHVNFEDFARGQQIGRSHARTSAGHIERHVALYFPNRTLASIKTADIERWMLALLDTGKYSAKSINLFICTLYTTDFVARYI